MLAFHGSPAAPSRAVTVWSFIAIIAIAVLALWATSPGLERVPAVFGYRLQGYWTGADAPGGALFRPFGVAVAPDGSVYVTDARERVVHFSPAGAVLGQWGQEGSSPGQALRSCRRAEFSSRMPTTTSFSGSRTLARHFAG